MNKYLRVVSVFLFSSLLFLIFLAGSGIVQIRGVDIVPRLGKFALWEPVRAAVDNRPALLPAAPDADVDLEIDVFDDPDPITAGTTIKYTVIITNHGFFTATNVLVTNDFPTSQLQFNQSLPNPEFCVKTDIIRCNLGELGIGSSTQFDLQMDVKSGATDPLVNTISVTTDDTDTNPSNNSVTVTTTIEYESDLVVMKVDNIDPAVPGGTLIYTTTVTNNGPSDAVGVILTDTLPGELNLVSITPSQGTCNESTMVCELGTIGANLSADVTLVTTVTQSTPVGTITNTAEVSSLDDSLLTNNTTTETTSIVAPNQADLSITKSDFPDPVAPGGTLTYTIDITNIGVSDATSVTITDTLPSEVNFVSITTSQGTCDDTTLVCELGTIITGTTNTASVTLETIVTQSTPLGRIITNTAEVSWLDDTLPFNDSITTTTIVNADVDLSVLKSAPPTVIAGDAQPLVYTVTVSNGSPIYDAPNVVIIDTLPAGVTFDSSTPGSPDCTEAAGIVACNLGTLSADSSGDVIINVTVDSDAVGPLINEVDISSDALDLIVTTNNHASTQTTVTYSSDISVSTVDDPDPVHPGGILTYTLTITNDGPSDANSVILTDTLPVDVSYLSSQPESLCYELSGVVTCNMSTLLASESFEFNIFVHVDPMAAGTLVNTAEVSSDTSDPNPEYNVDIIYTDVVDSADLVVDTTHTPEPAYPGDPLTYTLTITNNGPLDALNVVLTDNLPEEVSFISSIPDSPDCEHVLGVVVCDLGSINQGDSTQIVLITQIANDAWGTITNTAMVSSDLFDPVLDNNDYDEYTTVGDGANLSLSKTSSPDPVVTGGILTYTLTISNGGPLTATNVLLQDVLPGNVSFLTSSPASPTCAETDGVVNCTLGHLYSGETNAVSIIVQVSSSSIEPLINQATVSSVTYDQDEINNAASDTTSVIDVEAPTVEWISPVGDNQSFNVGCEVIHLEVEATDNVGVERVEFRWWDHEYNDYEGRWVDIDSVFVTPYSIEFDTSMLYYGYNQVYARAYDSSGNVSIYDPEYPDRILLFRLDIACLKYLPVITH